MTAFLLFRDVGRTLAPENRNRAASPKRVKYNAVSVCRVKAYMPYRSETSPIPVTARATQR